MSTNVEIIDFDKLEMYVIDGNIKNLPPHLHEIHQKSFKCWHETWNEFYNDELHISTKLFSNEFTRQDEILALFYEGDCFAVTFFKKVHWSDSTASLDSYFDPWPEEAIKGLRVQGDHILICSQFTTHKSYRDRKTNINWKTLLFNLSIKNFLESDCHAMTGTMRTTKGMGKMSVAAGGTMLMPEVTFKDNRYDPADLIAFFPQNVKAVYDQCPFAQELNNVWERRNGRLRQLRIAA